MSAVDNATERPPITPATRGAALNAHRLLGPGVAIGALGILGFSFSLPATRLAVADLDPWLVAFGRATVAALLAVAYLRATRAPRPTARQAALARDRRPRGRRRLPALHLARARVRDGRPRRRRDRDPPRGDGGRRGRCAPASGRRGASGSRAPPGSWPCSRSSRRRRAGRHDGGPAGRRPVPPRRHRAVRGRLRRGRRAVADARRPRRRSAGRSSSARRSRATVAGVAAATTGLHAGPTAWLGFAYVSVVSMFLGVLRLVRAAWRAAASRGSARSSSPSRC